MHQSIPPALSLHPPGYCGAFARLVSPGGGALRCPAAGHLPTPGPTPSFWHPSGFLSEYNYTKDSSTMGKN